MFNTFYNEDCFDTMERMKREGVEVSTIITSPFYNTNKKQGKNRTTLNSKNKKGWDYSRYDVHIDSMTNEEYIDYTLKLFDKYDSILRKDGCILYNLSYGSENTTAMPLTVAKIIEERNFTLADIIVWKKSTAMPNNMSHNKLTRLVEFVYVFCRKDEFKTFEANKAVTSVRKNGQKMYENVYNFIEAKNNDGPNPLNKSTYSTELVHKLMDIYVPEDGSVYDSFMGTGTTGIACYERGIPFIGSEISEAQVKFSYERLEEAKLLEVTK